jgi:formylglycine-generating enzyme required for sulfatase activity
VNAAPAAAIHAPSLAPVPVAVSCVGLDSLKVGRTAVTHAEYARFLVSGRAPAPPWWCQPGFDSPDHPVVGVTWYEAVAFSDWLSEVAGGRWRLPTTLEWEHAAWGGLSDAQTPWGESLPAAEVPEGPLEGPWLTGRGTPNGFGLMDMGTIVHEWCSDVVFDSRSPDGERRLSCGGSWRHRVRWSKPGARSSLPPSFRYADYGFRLVWEAA